MITAVAFVSLTLHLMGDVVNEWEHYQKSADRQRPQQRHENPRVLPFYYPEIKVVNHAMLNPFSVYNEIQFVGTNLLEYQERQISLTDYSSPIYI